MKNLYYTIFSVLFLLVMTMSGLAQQTVSRGSISGLKYADVPYKTGNISTYESQRCKLDIYIPNSAGSQPYPVIVYFYGGGLNSGDKSEGWADWSNNFGYKFLENGVAMVMVNYRLSGQSGTKWPAYIQDAASAVAWVTNNIGNYGGNPNNVYVMGFSAGAYLTHMLSIDPTWYNQISFDRSKIKGYIPISGQTRAHGTVAADLGLATSEDIMIYRPETMPMGHIAKTEKPIHLFVGEYEGQTITDNYNYYNQLLSQGSSNLYIYTNPGKDHGGMRDGLGDANSPTLIKIIDFISALSSDQHNIPGIVQAEAYSNMSGIQTESTSDTGGGLNVGWIDTGDWLTFDVNVATSGSYTVKYRVASQNGGGSIRLEKAGGGQVYGSINVPATGGWQTWQTISHTVQLTAGQQKIAIYVVAGGFNINWIELVSNASVPQYIQAESYSNMSGIQTETTSDQSGGLNVGWIDAGDWMSYSNINIPTSGSYVIAYRVASANGGGSLRLEQNGGATSYGTVNLPSTGGWQSWTTVYQTVNLNAGTQSFGIKALTAGWNFNWWSITKTTGSRQELTADIDDESTEIAAETQTYPNPFSNEVMIPIPDQFQKSGKITLTIYDLTGSVIRAITEKYENHELKQVKWDGKNNMGIAVSNGVYIYELKSLGNKIKGRVLKGE